jgi:hypothetical protein
MVVSDSTICPTDGSKTARSQASIRGLNSVNGDITRRANSSEICRNGDGGGDKGGGLMEDEDKKC